MKYRLSFTNKTETFLFLHLGRDRFWRFCLIRYERYEPFDEPIIMISGIPRFIFSYDRQLRGRLCLPVCLYVRLSVGASAIPLLPCFDHGMISMKSAPDIHLMISCIQVKRSKVKVTGVFQIFVVSTPWLNAYFTDLLCIWHKDNI